MASQNASSSGSSSGLLDKFVSFVTEPLGIALLVGAILAIATGYVVMF